MKQRSTRARHSRTGRYAAITTLSAVLLTSACSAANGGHGATGVSSQLIASLPKATGPVSTLNWNLPGEPDTLDPANVATYPSGTVTHSLCDPLLAMQPDFTIKPNLASYKVESPTKIVFTLRGGAKFWDGKPVTADDVAYSLNRTAKPKFVLSYIFANMKAAAATGPDQVTVTFNEPDEMFLHELPNIGIVEKTFAEKAGDALGTPSGGLMCSGPYKLDNWSSGNSLTIVANSDYWNPDLKPLAQTVKFTFISDGTALAQALSAGEIDGAYEIPPSAIPALQHSSTGTLTFGPSSQGVNVNVMTPGGPMSDVRLREALARILDRSAIAKVVYHGAATPTFTAITPSTLPVAQKAIYQPLYDKYAKLRSYDPGAAKKLVVASGYHGATIVLAVEAGDATSSQVAQLLQQGAKTIGVNIDIKTLQPLVFSQAGYDASKRAGIDLMIQSNFNGTADPLEPLGFDALPGQPYNYTNYDDPTTTKLLGEARADFDPVQRANRVVEAMDRIEATSAAIPVVSTNTVTFLNKRYTGAVTSFAYWSMPAMAYIGSK